MRPVKILGLLAVAAAALMALAGTASATVTSPSGAAYTGDIHASSTNTTLHGTVTITCTESTVAANIAGGATEASIGTLTFSSCNPDTVAVINKGTLKAVTVEGKKKLQSNGAEVTALIHRSIFGFPVTTHCIYQTNNTIIGEITEGNNPVLDIGSAQIEDKATDGSCGATSVWTGSYTVDTPKPLFVDV